MVPYDAAAGGACGGGDGVRHRRQTGAGVILAAAALVFALFFCHRVVVAFCGAGLGATLTLHAIVRGKL